jgi:hypothetical protein
MVLPSPPPGWQHGGVLASLLQQFRSEIHGQLSDRRRVIDHLLDVRLATADQPIVVAEVDRLLADLPGLTTVENAWWAVAIDDLERVGAAQPTPLS